MKVYKTTIEAMVDGTNQSTTIYNSDIRYVLEALMQLNNITPQFKFNVETTEMTREEFDQKVNANIKAALHKTENYIKDEMERRNQLFKDTLHFYDVARKN